ncbi:hypothetical protein [Bacillus sp. NEB1478]|uniref:hypothetical protein n=1 Tax=Bacillus sp. NEB1478 TaxID=3073816 RepID=UPI0028737C58|nr:hypothetical protein [Bacillus sp. NEB1478]WNB91048.1 hypothetical protein RGB74_14185 [Bacillus sp. NEB1478]
MSLYQLLYTIVSTSLMTLIARSENVVIEIMSVFVIVLATMFTYNAINKNPKKLYLKMPLYVSAEISGVVITGSIFFVKSFF